MDVVKASPGVGWPAGVTTGPGGLDVAAAAAHLYSDLHPDSYLRAVLARTARIVGGVAGSFSLIDAHRRRYTKVAQFGSSCRVGASLPLTEGMTGRVFQHRQPVVLTRYADIVHGHLPVGHPSWGRSVLAVPLWWRGDIVGVNVAFGDRRFRTAEVDRVETLTQLAATGLAASGLMSASGGPDRVASPPEGNRLTRRENEVLRLLARGCGDKAIAAELVLSPKTVEKHVGAVLRKTGAPSRTAAVVFAINQGWITVTGDSAPTELGSFPHAHSGTVSM